MTVFAHNIKYAHNSCNKYWRYEYKLLLFQHFLLFHCLQATAESLRYLNEHAHVHWTVSTVNRLRSYYSER